MPFPTQPIIDNTTRVNENPLSNGGVWGSVKANVQLLSNQIRAVTNATFYALTAASTSSANCESYLSMAALPVPTHNVRIYLRHDGVQNGYFVQFTNWAHATDAFEKADLYKLVSNVETVMMSTAAPVIVLPGYQLGIDVVGTTLNVYVNGTSIASTSNGEVTAAGITGFLADDDTTRITAVGGGPFGAPPPTGWGGRLSTQRNRRIREG